MEIEPLVTRAVLTVAETDSLQDAATWMIERGVGSAVVVATDGKPKGVVTDRDALRVVAQGCHRHEGLTVGDCLVGRLTVVKPSTEVMEAATIMRERGFRHLVVVDDDGELLGVFSMRDLVVGLIQELRTAAAPA